MRESLATWEPLENGASAETGSGQIRVAPRNSGVMIRLRPIYPMSDWQFKGIWRPWWFSMPEQGGPSNGTFRFWLRDPIDLKPQRHIRDPGQAIDAKRDGLSWLVMLPLLQLPRVWS